MRYRLLNDLSPGTPRPRRGSSATLSPAPGGRITKTGMGRTIAMAPECRWRHPWWTTPLWDAVRKVWTCVVKAGFVNGVSPTVRQHLGEVKPSQRVYGTNPLTGNPYFSEWVFSQDLTEGQAAMDIDLPLIASPSIDLNFRALGWEAPGTEVPQFFIDRGVHTQKAITSDDVVAALNGGTSIDLTGGTLPPGNRLLRACNIILHQPRMALTSQISIEPGLVTGISNVTQTLGLRSAAPGDRLKVFATAQWTDPNTGILNGEVNLVSGSDFEEPNYDELIVSTVYLLSPRNAQPGAKPDATWQPFVAHSLFWNLNYATPPFQILPTDPGTPFMVPLAGGAAQLVINEMTASFNDMTANALNLVTAHSMAGTFYTPTGGGSSAVFPDAPEAPITTANGLDKNARLKAQQAAIAKAKRREQLDPDFPYRALPFVPSLLTP